MTACSNLIGNEYYSMNDGWRIWFGLAASAKRMLDRYAITVASMLMAANPVPHLVVGAGRSDSVGVTVVLTHPLHERSRLQTVAPSPRSRLV
jgi:hypothetical protein